MSVCRSGRLSCWVLEEREAVTYCFASVLCPSSGGISLVVKLPGSVVKRLHLEDLNALLQEPYVYQVEVSRLELSISRDAIKGANF